MTNNTASDPENSPPVAATERRPGPLAGRLGARGSNVLGRGLDALLGNLRTAPKTPEPQPEPQPDEDPSKKYQTQARRALLSRLQSNPTVAEAPAAPVAPAAPPAAVTGTAPSRTDIGRGFVHLMQAGAPSPAGVATVGGETDENRVILVEVERLEPNPYHGDARHDPDSLRGVAQAVREQGVWQPLLVMPAPATPGDPVQRYWIISGERRWRAAIMVGLREVPVLVRQVTPRAALQLALAEHAHQGHMSPLTRCRVYGVLTNDMGMTIEEAAARVGVTPDDVVTNLLVLQADDFLQESFEREEITDNIVAMLMRVPAVETRRELLRYTLRYRWDEARLAKGIQSRGIEA